MHHSRPVSITKNIAMVARKFNPGPEVAFPILLLFFSLIVFAIVLSIGVSFGIVPTIAFVAVLYTSVPFIHFKIPAFSRNAIFMNKVKWISRSDYFDPDTYGLQGGRNFCLDSDPAVKIGVWHLLPNCLIKESRGKSEEFWTDSMRSSSSHPIVIYLHGNMGTRASGHRTELYQLLQEMECHVIAVDYRGYGDSTDVPVLTETGIVRDAVAMYEWAVKNSGEEVPIYFWGHSLGTGVATHAARVVSESNEKRLSGVILEAPFTNMKECVLSTFLTRIYRYFPGAERLFASPLPLNDIQFQSDVHILHIDAPILILHTENDEVVPVELGQKLYRLTHFHRKKHGGKPIYFELFPTFKLWAPHAFICRVPGLPGVIRKFFSASERSGLETTIPK